jgi:hypothetical protein
MAHRGKDALMMEALSTSEMSVNFYQTKWCNIPEDSHHHSRHCENLKSQLYKLHPDTAKECLHFKN